MNVNTSTTSKVLNSSMISIVSERNENNYVKVKKHYGPPVMNRKVKFMNLRTIKLNFIIKIK